MNISYLREFIAITECGSFEKAADQLFTTQSTLSKHIQKMEAMLKVSLFDRNSRKITLSDCGALLLPYAQKIVQLETQYTNALHNYTESSQITLNIGSVISFAPYHIAEILGDFQNAYPHIHLNVLGESPVMIQKKLLSQAYDLAFLRYRESEDMSHLKEFNIVPFTDDQLVVVCSRNHPLSNRDSVSLKELEHERILGYLDQTFMNSFIASVCADAGFTPNICMIANHIENHIELASRGIGVSLLMKKPVLGTYQPNISIIDIDPPYKCRVDLCYLKDKKLSKAEDQFIKFVQQWVIEHPIDDN